MKKKILIMFLLCCVAIGTLYALNLASNAPNRVANGFERKFLPIEATIAHQLEFTTAVRELAGRHGDSLFLVTGEAGKIYITDVTLRKPTTILLDDPKIENIVPRFYTTVRYPEVYIFGGNATSYAVGDLRNKKTSKHKLNLNGLFNNPILMDDHIIMQITDNNSRSARFGIVGLNGEILTKENNLSKGSADAGFVYSGILKYDPVGNRMVYVHFFDNNFDVFTPELELLYSGHTRDTTYTNPNKIVINGKSVSYASPPIRINSYSAVHNGYLYVTSMLLADNEDRKEFYKHTVLDQYNLDDGSYVGSFYLPNIDKQVITQYYFLSELKILALSEKNVVIIDISKKNFAKPNA